MCMSPLVWMSVFFFRTSQWWYNTSVCSEIDTKCDVIWLYSLFVKKNKKKKHRKVMKKSIWLWKGIPTPPLCTFRWQQMGNKMQGLIGKLLPKNLMWVPSYSDKHVSAFNLVLLIFNIQTALFSLAGSVVCMFIYLRQQTSDSVLYILVSVLWAALYACF